eukprot:5117565-Prymnesium_polylepis.1
MLRARSQLAQQLGHRSYAHYVASHGRMEADPEAVCASLEALCDRLAPRVAVEVAALEKLHGGAVGASVRAACQASV